VGNDLRVSFTYQDDPRGLGHAVGCARELVGDEPFVVMLPDELMGDSALLQQMIGVCDRTGGSVVGLIDVPRDQVGAYGVVAPEGEEDADGVVPIATMVEKPRPDEAPSTLIIIGRYVLTPDVFDRIAHLQPGAGGEIQLTDALRQQAEDGPFHGVRSRTVRHDTGNPFGWLTAVVDHALADPLLGDRFREWLDAHR
jgi:UTP--glucose-1-phosphate uridylyltransferase